ncbi:DHA2 family efflux MFS transporter permease subunit [Nocardia sp. NPDC055053]
MTSQRNPWWALAALIVGYFMILMDMTIAAVANPAIMSDLDADVTEVIWVTSAYLLGFAVPLLAAGRLGDRVGPKYLYLAGLTVFTLASLWCGLSGTVDMLIVARGVQGIGAALLVPQTMAVIARIFPADQRGAAMGVWGSAAGLATLVGPLLGGVLVDSLGWQWIFFLNIPVGILALALGAWLLPVLPTGMRRFDLVGVLLSGIGLFLLVYGIQEGENQDWSAQVWLLIGGGLVTMVVFVIHQAQADGEPLVPLSLFRDRNFALSSLAVAAMGVGFNAAMVPAYFYFQGVRGLSPTAAALVLAPMALGTVVCAPLAGRFSARLHPAVLPGVGFALLASVIGGLALLVADPDAPLVVFAVIAAFGGVANGFIWALLPAIATRNLPAHQSGAGSGVYSTTRQLGAVLGSAAIAALIAARLSAHGFDGEADVHGAVTGTVPPALRAAFSAAMSEAMYLPGLALLAGVIASTLFVRNRPEPLPAPATVPARDPELVSL